jgi:hypothetical protein
VRGHSTSTDGGRRGTLTDGELRVLPLHLPLGFSGGDGTRASTAAVCVAAGEGSGWADMPGDLLAKVLEELRLLRRRLAWVRGLSDDAAGVQWMEVPP